MNHLAYTNPLSVVVTSISAPNPALRDLAAGCIERGYNFTVVGDVPSPAHFSLEGCDFYSLAQQAKTGFRSAELLPTRHYTRKNLGYLLAIQQRSELILETDDDNFPRADFWLPRQRTHHGPVLEANGWTNVYKYFSDVNIWPRGLPLDAVQQELPDYASLPLTEVNCPIQQGLADENPDVDAIYRLILPLPVSFRQDRRIHLGNGAWCPFNSQNTTWYPEAYPLLYLPSFCTFRMTDIWRSFVAQRIAWANNWHILFHEANVYQLRNDHSLIRDFADEVPGYLHNRKIAETLDALQLALGVDSIPDNLRLCYEALISKTFVGSGELPLLEAWLEDLQHITAAQNA